MLAFLGTLSFFLKNFNFGVSNFFLILKFQKF